MPKMILRGKKVVLRPLSMKDAARFCKWLSDHEVVKFLSVYDAPPTLREEKIWLKKARADKKSPHLAVDTVDGEHIGSISLRLKNGATKVAEYGIFIGNKRYWGQGYGTEAGRLIVNYGFSNLKLHRIYLRYIGYNIRGEKSYKKIGFKVEGRLRQQIFRNGNWHDEVYMGLLKHEFKNK